MEAITKSFKTADTIAFFHIVRHPVKFRLFLLQQLPAAFFSGIRIKAANEDRCTVTVPFKWFTKNPLLKDGHIVHKKIDAKSANHSGTTKVYQKSHRSL